MINNKEHVLKSTYIKRHPEKIEMDFCSSSESSIPYLQTGKPYGWTIQYSYIHFIDNITLKTIFKCINGY